MVRRISIMSSEDYLILVARGATVATPARMRSTAQFKGHPIHPMLIPFPFAYLFGSALVNVWARTTNRPKWFQTTNHLSRLGIGSALVAAVPGIIDYVFAVPPRSSGRKRATSHAIANLSALGLFAAARIGRTNGDATPSRTAVAAELCGAGLLATGGWLGGTLVYRNQIGVDHRYAGAGKWRVDVIAPAPSTAGTDVGADNDLEPGQMKLLRLGGQRIVIGRTERGWVAFDDRCTHRGASLADGVLACDIVQCPWHGSQFNVHTGEVNRGPADEPIATYPITVRDGRLWLENVPSTGMEAASAARP
jgi:nitrite reductase/ring-hydroxylating ferredoxin subunit/uncharacterized membrane protein